MRKLLSLLGLSLLVILTTTSMLSKKQMQDIPQHHDTEGLLNEPKDIPSPVNIPMWEVVNNTDCEISINIWISLLGNSQPKGYTATVAKHSSKIITPLNFGLSPGAQVVTHASANLGVSTNNGGPYSTKEIYPGNGNFLTGQPTPCDCVNIAFNNYTITISKC